MGVIELLDLVKISFWRSIYLPRQNLEGYRQPGLFLRYRSCCWAHPNNRCLWRGDWGIHPCRSWGLILALALFFHEE